MINNRMREAYECSDRVLELINYSEYDQIKTQEVIEVVEKEKKCFIKIMKCSFKELSKQISDYGAMMWTELTSTNDKRANIILNSDKDIEFQRFSLLHELGHLMLSADNNLFVSNEKYVVSTHINYKLTEISEEQYEGNNFLQNEQKANVFALRVLMPYTTFSKKLDETDSLSETAKFFGVTKDAVKSRIMLVE